MSFNSQAADIAARFSNAAKSSSPEFKVFANRASKNLLSLMLQKNLISSYRISEHSNYFYIVVKNNKIRKITSVSKPGARRYSSVSDLRSYVSRTRGLSTSIVSTNLGYKTGSEAIESNVGGEVMFEVF